MSWLLRSAGLRRCGKSLSSQSWTAPDLSLTLTVVILEQTVVTAERAGETDDASNADGSDVS